MGHGVLVGDEQSPDEPQEAIKCARIRISYYGTWSGRASHESSYRTRLFCSTRRTLFRRWHQLLKLLAASAINPVVLGRTLLKNRLRSCSGVPPHILSINTVITCCANARSLAGSITIAHSRSPWIEEPSLEGWRPQAGLPGTLRPCVHGKQCRVFFLRDLCFH